jgi:iron complex transport system ATP-binding protein
MADKNIAQNNASTSPAVMPGHDDVQPLLDVSHLVGGYHKKEIVHDVSFTVGRGEFVCVIGANGCGKTTTLKTVLGLLPAFSGAVTVDGQDATKMKERERARAFAWIPQLHTPPYPYKVADVVLLGRTPHLASSVAAPKEADKRIAYGAMEKLGIEDLAERTYTHLSGGQQQLVLIARALAQQPQVLVMDEPTASLDFGNQQLVLNCLRKLSRTGLTVLMVTHDPHHALYVADRVLVMEDGRITESGTPSETITTRTLKRIYHSNVRVIDVKIKDTGELVHTCIPVMDDE